jgi:hypothetical protein
MAKRSRRRKTGASGGGSRGENRGKAGPERGGALNKNSRFSARRPPRGHPVIQCLSHASDAASDVRVTAVAI